MAVMSYTSAEQAGGKLTDTGLFERKPIGFREDDGLLSPYSNIFYWSYKWIETGTDCRLFMTESPLEPAYLTYAEKYRI